MDDLLSMSDIEAAKGKKLKAPKKEDTPVMNNQHTIKDTLYIAIITALVVGIGAFVYGNVYANQVHAEKASAVSAATASVLKDQTPQK